MVIRCAITLSDTWWYRIERFELLRYVRKVGLVKTFKQFKSGLLSFNPYKLRKSIEMLKKLDKCIMYGVPIISDTDKIWLLKCV